MTRQIGGDGKHAHCSLNWWTSVHSLEQEMVAPELGYRPQAADTSIEVDRFEFELLRQRTNADRFQMMVSCNRSTRQLSLFGLHRIYGHLTPEVFTLKVAEVFLGENRDGFKPEGNEMPWIQDSSSLTEMLHTRLNWK